MPEINAFNDWAATQPPWLLMGLGSLLLLLVAWLADLVTQRVLVRVLARVVRASPMKWDDALLERGVIQRLAHVVPALVIYVGIALLPLLPEALVRVTRNVAVAYIVLTLALAIGLLLSTINALYERRDPEKAHRLVHRW
jgi:miniconductance mechanosensitive channel